MGQHRRCWHSWVDDWRGAAPPQAIQLEVRIVERSSSWSQRSTTTKKCMKQRPKIIEIWGPNNRWLSSSSAALKSILLCIWKKLKRPFSAMLSNFFLWLFALVQSKYWFHLWKDTPVNIAMVCKEFAHFPRPGENDPCVRSTDGCWTNRVTCNSQQRDREYLLDRWTRLRILTLRDLIDVPVRVQF